MDFSLEQSIHLLARTPKVLWSQLEDLSPIWTQENYGPETWSVHDVIGHLIWGEKTDWIPRIRQILDPNQSNEFTPFDRDGHSDLCKERSFHQLLEMFEELRNENLSVLRNWNLSSEQSIQNGSPSCFWRSHHYPTNRSMDRPRFKSYRSNQQSHGLSILRRRWPLASVSIDSFATQSQIDSIVLARDLLLLGPLHRKLSGAGGICLGSFIQSVFCVAFFPSWAFLAVTPSFILF